MKKSREMEFLKILDFWLRQYNLIDSVIVQRDNRGDALAKVEEDDFNDEYILRYNWKILCHYRKHTRIETILHEIGHIIQNLLYNTEKQQIKSELEAEKFALSTMKKHYPVHYRREVNRMKKQLKSKSYQKRLDRVHLTAYLQVEDYK